MDPDNFDPGNLTGFGFPETPVIHGLIEGFLDHLEDEGKAAAEALRSGDEDAYRRLIHRLKGAAAMLGFLRLANFLGGHRGPLPDNSVQWIEDFEMLAGEARRAYENMGPYPTGTGSGDAPSPVQS